MYIRTKDGRVYNLESKEVSSWEYIDNDTAIKEYGVEGAFYTIYYFDENKGHYSERDDKGGHSCVFIEEKDILDKSDNLAELCDEFVLVDDVDNSHTLNRNLKELTMYKIYIAGSRGKIYGAIWTSRGLIYVAKMNEDGEFELLC